jgi:cell division protein FtsB
MSDTCEGCGAHWMQNCSCVEVVFEAVSINSYEKLKQEIQNLKAELEIVEHARQGWAHDAVEAQKENEKLKADREILSDFMIEISSGKWTRDKMISFAQKSLQNK